MYAHPDLAANVWTNPCEIAGNGVDNDGNGYVDESTAGTSTATTTRVYDGDAATTTARTSPAPSAARRQRHGRGRRVLEREAHLCQVPRPRGGTTANAIKAVDYFTDLKSRHGLNIVATNNSWGGGGYSQALYDAIERAKPPTSSSLPRPATAERRRRRRQRFKAAVSVELRQRQRHRGRRYHQ